MAHRGEPLYGGVHVKNVICWNNPIITGSSPGYAQTPSAGPKTTTLESLAKLVTKGFASADKKFAALAEDVAAVEKRLDARLDKSGRRRIHPCTSR
jgi:hypothetical protein